MRVLIDGCMARGGGGHTYLVNVMPRLARSAPRDRFRLLVRSPKVVEALPALPNLEVDLLPPVGFAVAGGEGASRVSVFVPAPVLKTTSNMIQAFQQAGGPEMEEDDAAPENETGQPRF